MIEFGVWKWIWFSIPQKYRTQPNHNHNLISITRRSQITIQSPNCKSTYQSCTNRTPITHQAESPKSIAHKANPNHAQSQPKSYTNWLESRRIRRLQVYNTIQALQAIQDFEVMQGRIATNTHSHGVTNTLAIGELGAKSQTQITDTVHSKNASTKSHNPKRRATL